MLRAIVCLSPLLHACTALEDDACDSTSFMVYFDPIDVEPADLVDSSYSTLSVMTAIGGAQRFDVQVFDYCGNQQPAAPITVTNHAPSTSAVTVNGTVMELRVFSAAAITLDVVTGRGVSSRSDFYIAPVSDVIFAARELGRPVAFLRGAELATIVLLSADGRPLVDSDMFVVGDIPTTQRPNELALANAPAGDHVLEVHAGGTRFARTLRIVDSIDEIDAPPSMTITDTNSIELCFFAKRQGELVGGAQWQIDFDKSTANQLQRANCVIVERSTASVNGTTVTAHAGGLTASTVITFGL